VSRFEVNPIVQEIELPLGSCSIGDTLSASVKDSPLVRKYRVDRIIRCTEKHMMVEVSEID